MISSGRFLSKKNIATPNTKGDGSKKKQKSPRIILAEKAR